jgi:hypothetical protein
MPERVLITGSRRWADTAHLVAVLDRIYAAHRPLTVVHGAARSGADLSARDWCEAMNDQPGNAEVIEDPHAADWYAPCRPACRPGHRRWRNGRDYCPAAGNYRNDDMVRLGADWCVAFFQPGEPNRGTTDCVRRALRAGIHVEAYGAVPGWLGRLVRSSPLSCGCPPEHHREAIRRVANTMQKHEGHR